jgi:hypothetical protein
MGATRILGMARHTALLSLVVALLAIPVSAQALCAEDPKPATFAQMIRDGSTHSGAYDRLFLGRVVRVRERTAVLVVRAHVGPAPNRARIKNGGVATPDSLILRDGRRYGLVVQRRDDGRWRFSDCGPSRRISEAKLRRLVRLARRVQ